MAKVKPAPAIESISGKLCAKNGQYIGLNKQTGKMYLAEYHEREDPNTEKQQAVRTTFTQKAQAASAWWNANKPTDDNKEGTEAYQALIKRYKSQRKIGSPFAYLRSLVQDDLTITIGGQTTTAPTVPEGSTSGNDTPPGTLD